MATLNISSKSDDWRASRLSNFSVHSFVLDGEEIASVEGFVQGIKFQEECLIRYHAFHSVGKEAKKNGASAKNEFVWWKGQAILYGSTEHHQLIERAIRAKFEQNEDAMRALVSTGNLTLIHELGSPESPNTSLPAAIFCDILTRIRSESRLAENHDPVPVLKRGCPVTLIEKPTGKESQHSPLTVGNVYEFLEWSGSNVLITTDVPGETASIHYSRIQYDGWEP